MKRKILYSLLSLAVLGALQPAAVLSQTDADADKTLAPYFFVQGGDPSVDKLPLKSTGVTAVVSGVIADVKIVQRYRNEGRRPIEALYVFPGSTGAAVYAMTMTVGERRIVAEVREKQEARRAYEKAKSEGKSTSLLEQQRPNVFQMNVANIMPGDAVQVELKYTELLVPADHKYQFVSPAVVGPRYTGKPAAGAAPGDTWVQNPYLKEGEDPTAEFSIAVDVKGGMALQEVSSPSHDVAVQFSSADSASIRLKSPDKQNGNRDFILNYRLAGEKVQTGLLLYQGEKENFFLALLEPPARLDVNEIPPREYIFIVDVSGSMHGFPLEVSKTLLQNLIGALRPNDTFNVVLFAGSHDVLAAQSLPASSENIGQALALISRNSGSGGTRILPALKTALALPRDEARSRSIIIATDGYVDVETEAFDVIRDNLGRANVFAFGIGSSVNRYLIEGMAHAGFGEPFIVTRPAEAAEAGAQFRRYVSSPVLSQVKMNFDGFEVYDVEPPSLPDVMAERPVVVFGKWRGKKEGRMILEGVTGKGRYERVLKLDDYQTDGQNSALALLWARHRIRLLSDYGRLRGNAEVKSEITNLGLTYNLLTQYTSFVAVDHVVLNTSGRQPESVKQPLPLPQGVSNLAVGGGELATGPEPSTWALIIAAALIMGWTFLEKRAFQRSRRA